MIVNEKRKKFIRSILPTLKIPPATMISLSFELRRQFERLKPGIVLDVGSGRSPHKKYIPRLKYMRLDADGKTEPDICCDLHKIEWQSDYFDTVIATEVLEHLWDPQRAISEIHRVLKPSGICILTTRFLFPYHASPAEYEDSFGDYYRFTSDSLNYLFKAFSKVEIYSHGNRIQALWQIINPSGYSRAKVQLALSVFLNILNPFIGRINFRDRRFPLGFVVCAKK